MARPQIHVTQSANAAPSPPFHVFSDDEWNRLSCSLCLTPQQAKIVGLILQGKRDKEIAAALTTTVPTIRTHLARLFARLGVADRVELVLHVFNHFRRGEETIHRKR